METHRVLRYKLHKVSLISFNMSEPYQPHNQEFEEEPPRKKSKTTPSSSNRFCFEFRLRTKIKSIYRLMNREEILTEDKTLPMIKQSYTMDPRLFKYRSKLCDAVAHMLTQLGVSNKLQSSPIELVSSYARSIVNRVSNVGCSKMLSMCVDLEIEGVYLSDQFEEITARVLQESTQEQEQGTGTGMVPASKTSIEELEKMEFKSKDSTHSKCIVCFEEFEEGLEVGRMPCSHTFHGHCIVMWLNKSHLCPICRFKMPVRED